jgi:hypothetical protein
VIEVSTVNDGVDGREEGQRMGRIRSSGEGAAQAEGLAVLWWLTACQKFLSGDSLRVAMLIRVPRTAKLNFAHRQWLQAYRAKAATVVFVNNGIFV